MRTAMHQEAFPGEDISDRPPPEDSVPGLLELIEGELPSGRYQAREILVAARLAMSALAFELPPALEATGPPEARGLARDGVGCWSPRRGDDTVRARPLLRPAGAARRPATCSWSTCRRRCRPRWPAAGATGPPVRVHFATRAPELDERWRVVELRSADGARPARGPGRRDDLTRSGGRPSARARWPRTRPGSRLLLARLDGDRRWRSCWPRHGEPIRYGYVERRWPLSAYQNVYATAPGSAEMPSAGRPFTERLITRSVARGISVAPITLHTGVSSPERHEPPFPEQYEVPAATARLVSSTRRRAAAA